MNALENQLYELLGNSGLGAGFSERLGMLWKESEIREFLEHFRAHKNSLSIHIANLTR